MCIAIPGKLIEMEGTQGKVDIRGNIIPVELGIVSARIGDYLLVHAGCAITVISSSDAEEISGLLDLVEQYNG